MKSLVSCREKIIQDFAKAQTEHLNQTKIFQSESSKRQKCIEKEWTRLIRSGSNQIARYAEGVEKKSKL